MKKILLTAIVITLNFTFTIAQNDSASNQYKMLNQHLHNINPYLFEKGENGTYQLNFRAFKGSPYENNKFFTGFITDELNNKKTKMYLRYNIYNDNIEMKADFYHPAEALLKKNDISCEMNGNSYHFLTFTSDKGYELDGYLILLYKGENYSLYQRLTARFIPKEIGVDNSYKRPKQAKFEQRISYYLKKDGKITYFPYKKRALLKSYPTLSGILKPYISKARPNLKNKSDLIGLVRHLDSNI